MRTINNAIIHADLRRHLIDYLGTMDNLDLNMLLEDELEGQFSEEDLLL